MNDLLKILLNPKGVASQRSLVVLLTIYVAAMVTHLDKRVALIEQRIDGGAVGGISRTNALDQASLLPAQSP